MANLNSPEKGLSSSLETGSESKLIVQQPPKLQELGQLLETMDSLAMKVSERTAEDVSGDLGGAAAGSGATQGSGARASARDQAIARMPSAPAVLQKELAEHVSKEIQSLKKEAKRISRVGKTGGAFELNELYTKIRKLHSVLAEILEASVDVLKRLFIRVFIDKQPIL